MEGRNNSTINCNSSRHILNKESECLVSVVESNNNNTSAKKLLIKCAIYKNENNCGLVSLGKKRNKITKSKY